MGKDIMKESHHMAGVSLSSVALGGEYGFHSISDLFYVPFIRFGSGEGTNSLSTIPKKSVRINRTTQFVENSYVSQEHRKSIVVGSERGTKTLTLGSDQG